MKIRNVLQNKGPEVITIGSEKTVAEAISLLVRNNIGVLVVLNFDAKIVGIISERDIIRCCYSNPTTYLETKINEIMTKNVIFAEPEDELSYVESIMTKNKIRHVPILENGVLIGMISIGDVVKTLLSDSRFENKYLMDYIAGNIA